MKTIQLTIEVEEYEEAILLLKAKDYYFALYEVKELLRRTLKYKEPSEDDLEKFSVEFYDILQNKDINLDLLQ